MPKFELDAEAGEVSAELVRRGIPSTSRVHLVVEVEAVDPLPLAAIAQAGGAFDWLDEEPDLYTEADLLPAR